jgi:hypothetical protein
MTASLMDTMSAGKKLSVLGPFALTHLLTFTAFPDIKKTLTES